jgi:hypothetical protein
MQCLRHGSGAQGAGGDHTHYHAVMAVQGGRADFLAMLVRWGGNIFPVNHTLMAMAANTGCADMVRPLLECDPNPKALADGLHAAAQKGHLDIVHMILQHNPNMQVSSALVSAVKENHMDVVRLLLTRSCCPEEWGEATRIAAASERLELLRALLDSPRRTSTRSATAISAGVCWRQPSRGGGDACIHEVLNHPNGLPADDAIKADAICMALTAAVAYRKVETAALLMEWWRQALAPTPITEVAGTRSVARTQTQ